MMKLMKLKASKILLGVSRQLCIPDTIPDSIYKSKKRKGIAAQCTSPYYGTELPKDPLVMPSTRSFPSFQRANFLP